MRIRLEGCGTQLFFHTYAAQHLHRIGHHLDPCAHALKALGLLVDLHIEAGATQSCGHGQAAHSGADNRKGELLRAHSQLVDSYCACFNSTRISSKAWSLRFSSPCAWSFGPK